ncbi:MAG: acyl-CoA dehydrogenase family protein, partial [Leeuwenhoekiella sp.]
MFNSKEHINVFLSLSDDDRKFPKQAFNLLKKLNLLTVTLPEEFGGKNLGVSGGNSELLNMLKSVGRADLSVGRIYEGHINALLLIERFATVQQKKNYYKDAYDGKLFSVWNTQRPFEAMSITKENDNQFKLKGAKTYCSGGLNIQRPIITAIGNTESQMIVLETEKYPALKEDWSLWKPLGMRASVSTRIDFSELLVNSDQLLGLEADYFKEP